MIESFSPYVGIKNPYNSCHRFIESHVEAGNGSKIAIETLDKQITYAELLENVNRFGNGIKRLGVERENRILLVAYDSPEFIISFFGSIKTGVLPVPVNTMMTPTDYEYFLNNSRAKVLVIQQEIWQKIKMNKDKFLFLQHIIIIADDKDLLEEEEILFTDLLNEGSTDLTAEWTTMEDTAFWLYSSGSTGEPKGVIHLQKSMEQAYNNYARNILQITEDDRTFSASKLFFAYGLGNGMYFPFGAGATTILLKEPPRPENIFKTIEDKKPTVFFGVPTLYGSMINYVENTGRKPDLSSIRVCISAGESLPAPYVRKWKELFNLDILDGIGSTEALHIFLSNKQGDITPGSSGKLVSGYDAKIVNDDFIEVETNEIGDLVIKGESITQGYWCNMNENHRKFFGDWMYTGDKYYQDEQGHYWYCGRSDDMLKVGGIWVSPIEIESALLHHEYVLEVAVVAAIKDNGLIHPKAFIVLKKEVEPDDELVRVLQTHVKVHLAPYKYPRIIEFVKELPKTATGKLQRFKLRT